MNVDKSTRYRRRRLRADVASTVLSLTGLCLWWLVGRRVLAPSVSVGGGGDEFDAWWRLVSWASVGLLLMQVVSMPARLYRDVFLERRYFPDTPASRHWGRRALGTAVLAACSGGCALGTTVWLWQRWPFGWWLVTGSLLACLRLVWATVVPALLIPRVAVIAPLSRTSLYTRLATLAARAGAPAPRVVRWTVDGHPDRAQAALAGIGAGRSILLSDGLLEAYSDDEVEVVVAHELAHAAHGDIWMTLAAQVALDLTGLWGLGLVWPEVASWIGAQSPPTAVDLGVVVLMGWAWLGACAPVLHTLARWQERRADAFALAVTGRPDAFLTALRRLKQEHLADDSAPALVHWWTQSHPRIAERVAMAEAFTRQSSSRATLSPGRM